MNVAFDRIGEDVTRYFSGGHKARVYVAHTHTRARVSLIITYTLLLKREIECTDIICRWSFTCNISETGRAGRHEPAAYSPAVAIDFADRKRLMKNSWRWLIKRSQFSGFWRPHGKRLWENRRGLFFDNEPIVNGSLAINDPAESRGENDVSISPFPKSPPALSAAI